MKKRSIIRHTIQTAATVLSNGYLVGFMHGKIYMGDTKAVCVPMLNCYSCPGALGACPIGSLQAVMGSKKYSMSFYVFGLLALFGVVLGRVVCGFLCPFGFVQELLHKIPLPKVKVPGVIDKPLRYAKYVILILLITLPLVVTNKYGIASPYFCEFICPAGTLEGGLPLISMDAGLRSQIGPLFFWKLFILIAILLLSIIIDRPFCKYLCPLGGWYGLFNHVSLYKLNLDKVSCIDCKACEKVCPMDVEVTRDINSAECIRCGRCMDVCPSDAIKRGRIH